MPLQYNPQPLRRMLPVQGVACIFHNVLVSPLDYRIEQLTVLGSVQNPVSNIIQTFASRFYTFYLTLFNIFILANASLRSHSRGGAIVPYLRNSTFLTLCHFYDIILFLIPHHNHNFCLFILLRDFLKFF